MSAASSLPPTREWESVEVGEALPPLVLELTATLIVAGAIATRDFMPVHHDKAYANAQGSPDIFMNILSDTGHVSRFLTDWAGPEAMVRRLAIRLGVPVFPGTVVTYTGSVVGVRDDDGSGTENAGGVVDGLVDIELAGATDLGDHVTGTATLALPRRRTGAG